MFTCSVGEEEAEGTMMATAVQAEATGQIRETPVDGGGVTHGVAVVEEEGAEDLDQVVEAIHV